MYHMFGYDQNSILAFVVYEDIVYYFHSPWFEPEQIDLKTMDSLGLHFNFDLCDEDFETIEEVQEYLGIKYVELLKKRGIKTPSTEELKELLEYADDEILLEYLQRTRDELIPDGDLDTAETVIVDIMALGRNNVEISKMAADVLREIQKKSECVE